MANAGTSSSSPSSCTTSSSAIIDGIFLTPTASSLMQSVQTGLLIAGVGLEGDRYAQQEGTYSVLLPKEPGRQLTLISADSVEQALQDQSLPPLATVGSLRRNIVIRGSSLTAQDLLQAIGKVVALGSTARVLLHRNCVPCMYNEKKNAKPGMMEALWDVAGVNAEILVGGPIAVGDTVQILEHDNHVQEQQQLPLPLPPADDGNKPPWFYIRPSLRNLAMVQEGIAKRRQSKLQLTETDPQGVARAEASFASVGLSFFPPDKK